MRSVRAYIAVSLLIPFLLFAMAAVYDRQRLRSEAQASADRTVVALAEHAQRVLSAQDSALRRIAERLQDRPLETLRTDAGMHRWFRQLSSEVSFLRAVAIVDSRGDAVMITNKFPAPTISASDRAYFQAFVRNPELEQYLSEPIIGRPTGEPIIQYARRLSGPDGAFRGVIMASASPREIAAFYAKVVAQGDAVALKRADGPVLVQVSAGRSPKVVALAATRPVGTWPARVEYRVGAHRLYAQWRDDVLLMGGILSAAALALIAFGSYALRRARSEQTAIARYQEEAAARARVDAEAEFEARMKATRGELAQVSKSSSMSAVAATIAHEVNQPLGAMSGYLHGAIRALESGVPDTDIVRQALREAEGEILRAGSIINRLRRLTANGDLMLEPLSLDAAIGEAVTLLRSEAKARGVSVSLRLDPAADRVLADRVQVQLLLFNLLRNAVEASGNRPGELRIETSIRGARAEIRILDRGDGLDESIAARLFEPFITTKSDGMGVGLSICQSIARAHGGELTGRSREGGGAVFAVTLSLATAALSVDT